MSAIATMKALIEPELQKRPMLLEQSPPSFPPKLSITSTTVGSAFSPISSADSSPTSSTSSSIAHLSDPETVSFSFSSPLFYDQKLYIYHSLLQLYQQLGKCFTKHPVILLILQYTVATIHGFTVYLLSVILSLAQLIMITATIENLDWIQSYKPLMCEWDSRFPGFVFPALDIDSESEEDSVKYSHGERRRWSAQTILRPCDDHVDDGYHSEECQKRLAMKQSLNSTLRKRLAKYQPWIPALWTADESSMEEGTEQETDQDSEQNTQDRYSHRIRRAVARTLSGTYRPAQNKRVTFNEQVLILGRRRSSEASQASTSYAASVASSDSESTHTADTVHPPEARKVAEPRLSVSKEEMESMAQDEAEYRRQTASEDTNGSGSSSPQFESSPGPATPGSTANNGTAAAPAKDSPDLRRSTSVPHKIGSFLSRHNNGPRQTSPRHSATFSESSTVGQNPRTVTGTPFQPATGPNVGSVSALRLRPSTPESTPRSSLSLGTRAKRSFSLVLPRPPSVAAQTETDTSLERQDSIGKKNKNFMYRIVHPQRYKRELEQQLSEQERQRLLTLAQMQRRHLLAGDLSEAGQKSGPRDANPIVCGDAYYYATSTEYIEGLGAPNSVISTSIGTSFPAELQHKSSKGRARTKERPASYDYGSSDFRVRAGFQEGNGSVGVSAAKIQRQPQHGFLFKRDSKKEAMPKIPQEVTRSPSNRLQQLFSHPGHKQTQSTSSLIVPAGSNAALGSMDPPGQSNQQAVFSSVAAAGAHRLLSRARSTSRNFTSFTSLGMPAYPPAQPNVTVATAAAPLTSSTGFFSIHGAQDPAMEHTTFAAFGFPSPTQSPDHSAPASPRHSTSSMPTDTPSRIQSLNDFHASIIRRHPFLESDMVYGRVDGSAGSSEVDQQEVLLQDSMSEETGFEEDGSSPSGSSASSVADMQLLNSQASFQKGVSPPHLAFENWQQHPRDGSMVSTGSMGGAKESRGKMFLRKLSFKKKVPVE